MDYDVKFMKRAIELARMGAGAVNPNPMVGAVIVKDGRIIGEGYHRRYGDLHAERDAFKNLTEDATGAQMYVTLEPCCHHGKQPPCVMAIVEHKISKVFCGSDDPNEMVGGKGFSYLKEHGIEVETHVLKEECDDINQVFFHYITTKRPYIIMKYAMTMDGKIASYSKKSQWISNEKSREDSARLRNEISGIMVGIGTVLADNPRLTCRISGGRNPVRIICDTHFQIPDECNLVNSVDEARLIVAVGSSVLNELELDEELKQKYELLNSKGVEIHFTKENNGHLDLNDLMDYLGSISIDGIIVEGGGTLNESLMKQGLVNEVIIYLAPKLMGGKEAISPVAGVGFDSPDEAMKFKLVKSEIIDGDIKLTYRR